MLDKVFILISLIWICPLICVVQNKEAKFKKGLAIGVTLPKQAELDSEILDLLDEYKKDNKRLNWIFLVLSLICLIPKIIWSVTLLILWCYVLIVVFNVVFARYNKKLREIKKDRGWATSKTGAEETNHVSVDDDDKWIWGLFYYNKNDSHFMVNQRNGMGTTINFAKPAGRFFAIITVIIMIGALILPICLGIAITPDITMEVQEDMLHVENGKDVWDVKFEDIETVELLDEYPEKLSRTWGTATDEIIKGNYSSVPYKVMNICLNPGETPYLLIKVHSGKYYLFGVTEDGSIQKIYDQLSAIIK